MEEVSRQVMRKYRARLSGHQLQGRGFKVDGEHIPYQEYLR